MPKQKQKKQSRLDCLGESLSELHGELEIHRHEFPMCMHIIIFLITSRRSIGKERAKEERKRSEY